ncbi:hypothetical protein CROQUDRAFT_668274 [Cronartium quercuum f. sp. fusiforme G11]|uniref:LCCL domain-containing protein n=1 Tax=Cronartium quercuum f. sp. fusiforme G11 TaxID=708437 RepID=A0A9P6NRL4_9BASI|nr:hypothetical protein CROQUDRAFT_668274 [Cronartium quercuum f. sp. fusiforme G11]
MSLEISSDLEYGRSGSDKLQPVSIQRHLDTYSQALFNSLLPRTLSNWLDGPSDPPQSDSLSSSFPRIEGALARSPLAYARFPALTWVLIFFTFLANLLLVHHSWYASDSDTFTFIGCTATFWLKDAGCGLDGKVCAPFDNSSLAFRCPSRCASVTLLNPRTIGDRSINYQPLVVGSGPYRADSFICQAAIHAGFVSNRHGGCGVVRMVGESDEFVGEKANGIQSLPFDASFPSAFEFEELPNDSTCNDRWDLILAFNLFVTFFFGIVLRPKPAIFYCILVWVGYWTNVFATDPNESPPNVSEAMSNFLPYLFVCWSFWRVAWKRVMKTFETHSMSFESALYYLPAWWLGALVNLTAGWVPIDRLMVHDVQQKPGGVAAVIVLGIFVCCLVFIQVRSLRRSGQLKSLVKGYTVVMGILFCLSIIPGYTLRLHHYLTAIFFTPLTAVPTRLSAIIQAFLLGLLQNGLARWSFASILEQASSLIGDGALGSPVPNFLPNLTSWAPIPEDLRANFDSFALLLDDVLRYVGPNTWIEVPQTWAPGSNHYLRLAFASSQTSGVYGDFSKPATFVVPSNSSLGLVLQQAA